MARPSRQKGARLLGVRSVNTVKRLIRDGRLRAIRPGSHVGNVDQPVIG